MKRGLAVVLVGVLLLAAGLVVRAVSLPSRQLVVEPVPPMAVDPGAAGRLARAVTFRTVSYQDPAETDPEQFRALHRYLEASFPGVHRTLRRELVSELSLLFTWTGRDPAARPLLFLSHLDVVPVESETAWSHPPFAGEIADGHVWGRGALDDKLGVLGLLEAVESLLRDGFQPRRTIYLAFGHDEEVLGRRGAPAIAALLGERGVTPELVLDEGLPVVVGQFSGVRAPVATIGIAEKGYVSVELTVEGEGGHSSMPPPETPVGTLAKAITRLEAHRPRPALAGAARQLLAAVAPHMDLGRRIAIANLWLFGPLVEWQLTGSPVTDALIRTTTAPTMLEGGPKENVLPARARAVVNFRIRPGDSVAGVLAHVQATVADARVKAVPLPSAMRSEPSPESSIESSAFQTLARTIREVFPDALVVPSLVLGATDARHYATLAPGAVYRFIPVRMRPEDRRRVHGIDERIAVAGYEDAVRFYARLIRNAEP
jgi:carboxypeptidase PM20D1